MCCTWFDEYSTLTLIREAFIVSLVKQLKLRSGDVEIDYIIEMGFSEGVREAVDSEVPKSKTI